MNTATQLIDRLSDTCESHARCNIVEVMGRQAGYIALEVGIACGAVAIAIREIPFNEKEAIEKINHLRSVGKRDFIVVVAEGLVGLSEHLAKVIPEATGIDTRFARLAHIVRGGSPSLRDRVLATTMGDCAVDCLLEGKSGLVICERNNEIVSMNITFALELDRMYKGQLTEGELAKYPISVIDDMKTLCHERETYIKKTYEVADRISR